MDKLFLTLALLVALPCLSLAQQRNAFIDPNTGVVKAVGYVEANVAGEVKIPVPADIEITPGQSRWDGKNWVTDRAAADPALLDLQELAFAIDKAVSSPVVPAEVKDVLMRLKKVLANGR